MRHREPSWRAIGRRWACVELVRVGTAESGVDAAWPACHLAPARGYHDRRRPVAGRRTTRPHRDVILHALIHLLLTGTPRVRRPGAPAARVARAVQPDPAPDRLRPLRGTVWIASTTHIPGPPRQG